MINEGLYQRWLMKSSLSPVFSLLFVLALACSHCFARLDCADFLLHNENANNSRTFYFLSLHFSSFAVLLPLSASSINDFWMSLSVFLNLSECEHFHWFLTMNGDCMNEEPFLFILLVTFHCVLFGEDGYKLKQQFMKFKSWHDQMSDFSSAG